MSKRLAFIVLFLALLAILGAACTETTYTWTVTTCDGAQHVVTAALCSKAESGRTTCWPAWNEAPVLDVPCATGLVRGE